MLGDEVATRRIDIFTKATIAPYDDCCYELKVFRFNKEIESGIWCPKSHILAMDGEVVGFYDTKIEVLKSIRPMLRFGFAIRYRPRWRM